MQIDSITPVGIVALSDGSRPASAAPKKAELATPRADENSELEKSLDATNKLLEPHNLSLRFSKHEDTGMIVVKLVNQYGETLRQLPSQASLQIAASLTRLQGKLLNLTA